MAENEIDILDIDAKIRADFKAEEEKLSHYRKRLSELKKTHKSKKLNYRLITELEKDISKLSEKISELENGNAMNFYIAETADILQRYKQFLRTPLKVSFMGRPKSNTTEKNAIISEYVKIAQRYRDIHFAPSSKPKKMVCDNCPNKTDFIIEENLSICPECGSQQEMLKHISSYKDIDRVNISARYTYDRKVHFRDCINQYQGKQNCTIDQKIYNDLEDILERHHLLNGKKGDKKDYRFAKVETEHVLMFLRELGYSKHYENVNLIHYNLTGKKPDDISYLEDKLLNDFDILIDIYDKKFKNKVDRVNFISTQYVLYQLLKKYNHPCKKEDFVILKTVDRASFHDTICCELFAMAGWNSQSQF